VSGMIDSDSSPITTSLEGLYRRSEPGPPSILRVGCVKAIDVPASQLLIAGDSVEFGNVYGYSTGFRKVL
jgi:hypothetical protein